jgi:hypothetical protein
MHYNPKDVQVGDVLEISPIGRVRVVEKCSSYNRLVMIVEKIGEKDQENDKGKQLLVLKFCIFQDVPSSMMSVPDLITLERDITTYRDTLRHDVGVLTSFNTGFLHKETPDGKSVLIQYEDYAGETCSDSILKGDELSVLQIVNAILECCVKPLFEKSSHPYDRGNLTTGADLNPRNFTSMYRKDLFNSNLKPELLRKFRGDLLAFCVDLHPAKFWVDESKGEFWSKELYRYKLEYPEPVDALVYELGVFRHFNRAGLILNFWTNLVRIRPDMAQIFYDLLEKFLRDNGFNGTEESLSQYLIEGISGIKANDNLLDIGKWPKERIAQILKPLGFKDIFRIRALAGARAFQYQESRLQLEPIFRDSHFQNNLLPQPQIDKVKEGVIAMFD